MATFLKSLFRTQSMDNAKTRGNELARCLNAFDLTLLGIGGIIGAGIFVLTGIAAATQAGPGVVLSYALAGLACAFCALAYAELASSIGGCGSAYGYALVGLGEIVAWLIGWDLLLEYGVVSATVAIGWSGYVNNAFLAMGFSLPEILLKGPFDGGIVNLPAVLIITFISTLLCLGIRESARLNKIMVFVKLGAILLFVVLAAFYFRPDENWSPFLPFGSLGIVNGAALIFFSYIGFDAVSTAAEETINPERNLPIGIMASLAICTAVYMLVAAFLTGAVSYTELDVSSPISYALLKLGYHFGSFLVAIGAIAGLTSTILVMYYALTRVFLAMARDGFFSPALSRIHIGTKTPMRIIIMTGILIALAAGFAPIHAVAELANIGTLAAFATVCLG
ncbi:MAG: amino acid permease, partial [Gammaproteobacteria bacterium]